MFFRYKFLKNFVFCFKKLIFGLLTNNQTVHLMYWTINKFKSSKRFVAEHLLLLFSLILCVSIQAQSNYQVILSYPSDGARLSTYLPNFAWNSSLAGDFEYSYNIHIAHLDSGQTYSDAMLYNPPLVYEQQLSNTNFLYPISAFPLEDSNRYVWQIETVVNGNIISYSDIWMFYYESRKAIRKKETVNAPDDHVYPSLQRTLNAAFYVFSNTISFKYRNESGDSTLNMNIYRTGTTDNIQNVAYSPAYLKPFDNYISIPVSNAFARSKPYILEVRNRRNEVWKMKFIVKE